MVDKAKGGEGDGYRFQQEQQCGCFWWIRRKSSNSGENRKRPKLCSFLTYNLEICHEHLKICREGTLQNSEVTFTKYFFEFLNFSIQKMQKTLKT